LQRDGYNISSAHDGEEGLRRIKAWNPQLILLDINMPGLDGIKTLDRIRRLPDHDYIAVIFISANMTTEDIVRGLDAGADDYLVKPFRIAELLARVRAKLRIKELHDQLKRTSKRLEELVDLDDLTGLLNMRSLFRRLEQEITRSKRYNKWISAIMLDMDFFKNVNDTNDHLFGSWVLTQVAKILRENSRTVDIAARYGGDEFLIILPETDQAGAERVADRMRKAIETFPFVQEKQKAKLTCSFGICSVNCGTREIDPKEFIRIADQMLYEAKNAGRNCVKAKIMSQ
jgi:two-component system, cell cycle response regulator